MPSREPSGRRRVVVGEGRVLLLVLLDRADLALRPRQDAEVPRRRPPSPARCPRRPGRRARPWCRGCWPGRRRARRDRPRCRRRSRPPGRSRGARPRSTRAGPGRSRGPRSGRARATSSCGSRCGRAASPFGADQMPGLLAAGGEVVALERVEERRVGRVDDVADDVADALAVRVGRDLDHRRDDRRLDRDRQHPLDLGDRPLGDDPRRGQAGVETLARASHDVAAMNAG